jgi:hypothetical protein
MERNEDDLILDVALLVEAIHADADLPKRSPTVARQIIRAVREHDGLALRKALMPTTASSHALPASDYQVF